jgi:hypothetical protein
MKGQVKSQLAAVYYSPTRNRRYLTREAAFRAEAVAIIKLKHPTEKDEHDERGYCTYPGFHWTQLPNAQKLLRRVIRLIDIS